jgi:hypothetical protein
MMSTKISLGLASYGVASYSALIFPAVANQYHFFPATRFKEVRMKWLLLLTILSGYSGSSTVAANFDSKDVCEAAAGGGCQHLTPQ